MLITGFNPECKDEKADAKNQVMIGSVQFPNGEIYKAAIKADMGIREEPYGFAAGKYKYYDGEYVVAQRNQWGDM